MKENFDDLFDDFFKDNLKNKNDFNSIHEELRKIMDSIMNYKKTNVLKTDDEIENELGKPDKTSEFTEDGFLFKKMVWETPRGQYVKIEVTDTRHSDSSQPKKLTLEEQLQEAVESENYELAIQLRDQIKSKK